MEKIHEEVLAAFFVLGRDQSGRSLPSEGSGQKIEQARHDQGWLGV